MPRPANITNKEIKDSLGHVIRVGEYLDQGRDGIVYKGQYTKGPQFDVAIKFYVPIQFDTLFSTPSTILPEFAKDLESKKDNELKILKNMNHAHLQKYLSSGTLTYNKKYFNKFTSDIKLGGVVPFIVSHYIKGNRLDNLIDSNFCSRSDFVSYILGLAKAIQYLHLNNVLHGDIRTSNALIDEETNRSMLIDFGVSKYFSRDLKGTTKCFLDPNLVPDTIKDHLQRIEKRPGNFERQDLHKLVFPILDLYQFGLMIKDILHSKYGSFLTKFDRTYFYHLSIDLMQCEITSESHQNIRIKLGGFIENADDLVNKLERLNIGPDYYNRTFLKQEKLSHKVINKPHELVEIRDSLSRILDHPTLRRLQNINQLSLIHYIYPSARQSRFDHSLSTLSRCQDLWKSLSNDPTFLYHINSEDVNKMEIIALIHDINHFPFLHYFQEAGIKQIKKAEVLNTFLKTKFKSATTGKETSLEDVLKQHHITIELISNCLSNNIYTNWRPADQIIKSAINSGVDLDKMAYLIDDAYFTGVPYGSGVDIKGLFNDIEINKHHDGLNELWSIIFSYNALPAIESLCFARYWNFQRIYWHHTNRAIASMIIWTIRKIYHNNSKTTPEDYFVETANKGEEGALAYLTNKYSEIFKNEKPPPIAELEKSRELVYRRIFEKPLIDYSENIINAFRDEERGYENRENAQERVFSVVKEYLTKSKFDQDIEPQEVLIDVPYRSMDLGGPIFVRGLDDHIRPATEISKVLEYLAKSFEEMSKILRVFVSPRIRDALKNKLLITGEKALTKKLYDAIIDIKETTEVC